MLTLCERLAGFAFELRLEDVPGRVRDKARHQILAVLGALYGSAGSADARAVRSALEPRAGAGPARLLPGRVPARTEDALFAAAAATMALDFDDYVFAGHTGHSAVLTSLLVGAETGASGTDALVAQIVANEVAARIGAAMIIGPLNGQMWAPIHAAAAACAAGRLLGLDASQLADAIGIALAAPSMPLVPGFMGSGAKVLTAATPAAAGVAAARLAACGMRGARDVIEGRGGLLDRFAYAPAPFFFGGLGQAWLTDTIAYKVYPGCAYIGSAIDALLSILGRDAIDPAEVDRVDVHASIVTVGMQHLSEAHAPAGALSPVNINFSIPFNVALVLQHGRLDPRVLQEAALARHEPALRELAARVHVHHDWEMTAALATAVERSLHLRHALTSLDLGGVLRARRELAGGIGLGGVRGARQALAQLSRLGRTAWRSARGATRRPPGSHRPGANGYDLGRADLESFTFPFGARVELRTSSGRRFEAEVRRPRGTPGDWQDSFHWTEDKLRREAHFAGADSQVTPILDIVRNYSNSTPRSLLDVL